MEIKKKKIQVVIRLRLEIKLLLECNSRVKTLLMTLDNLDLIITNKLILQILANFRKIIIVRVQNKLIKIMGLMILVILGMLKCNNQ